MKRILWIIGVVVFCTIFPGIADELMVAAVALVIWMTKRKKA